MKTSLYILAGALAATALTGCTESNEWNLRGTIAGHGDEKYVVEAYDNGRWYVLDSVKVSDNGSFSFSHEAMGYPDIYRLRTGETSFYFPIDSIETVELTADVAEPSKGYRISGTSDAAAMMRVDSLINASLAKSGPASVAADSVLKLELSRIVISDPAAITSYYIINRKVNGTPVFDASNRKDLRVIGAVANAFSSMRPADPRTAYLSRLFLENRKASARRDSVNVIYANEIQAPEIKLYDNKGKEQSLLETVGQGYPVILNFTVYGADESPAFNVMLNSIYEKYRSSGLRIYQVAFDDNEYTWKKTADNLPWTTVITSMADAQKVLMNYNVVAIPTSFIFDRNGDVVERITDQSELESALARHI